MVTGDNTDHGHTHGPGIGTCDGPQHSLHRQYRPQTSMQPSAEAQAMNTIMAPGGSSANGHHRGFRLQWDHRPQHVFRRQHGPPTSTWPLVAARPMDITAPGCSMTTEPNVAISVASGGCRVVTWIATIFKGLLLFLRDVLWDFI